MTDTPTPPTGNDDVPEQMRVRMEKRDRILASGGEAYPAEVPRTHTLAEIRETYSGHAADNSTEVTVGVAGRVMILRTTGKLCFASSRDGGGTELQVTSCQGGDGT